MSPEVESAVNELMAISGKPKELCTQALQAANGIPDIAFEFLISGQIPPVGAMGGGAEEEDEPYGPEDDGGEAGAGLGGYNLDP